MDPKPSRRKHAKSARDLPLTRMRRLPSQSRSRERVERILRSAAELVAARGADALNMAELARLAQVPVGTVYQFFSSKEELIQALAEQYVRGVFDLLAPLAARIEAAEHWQTAIEETLRAYVRYYRITPGLRELWIGARVDPAFVRHDHVHNNPQLARQLARLLRPRAVVSSKRLEVMVLCAWEAGQALIEQAFRLNPKGDLAVLREARTMLVQYLALAFEPGRGQPKARR